MRLEINALEKPSPCQLVFYQDGSFGQGEPFFSLDYEINLSRYGTLELLASKETGICYCLQGFSWKLFMKSATGEIIIDSFVEGQLRFFFEKGDSTEWGTAFSREFNLSVVDRKKRLALYGAMPKNSNIVRFASDQFICECEGEIVGFIIGFSDLAL